MKAPEFDYVKPPSIEKVLSLLSEHGDDARVLAGGQSLLASLNMRLSEPRLLIDISGIASLKELAVNGNTLRIGALVTHTEIEESPLIKRHAPLLAAAAPHIAHRAIRNSGTWGGSIAYADPAAEWPACLLALGGDVIAQGPSGERRIPADEFFVGLYTTALAPEEILIACEIPIPKDNHWFGFDELARRHGDYAIVGLVATGLRSGHSLSQLRIVFMGVDTTPFRARQTELFLENKELNAQAMSEAKAVLIKEIVPIPDLTNSTETKRHLASVLLERQLKSAASQPV